MTTKIVPIVKDDDPDFADNSDDQNQNDTVDDNFMSIDDIQSLCKYQAD